MVVAVLLRMDEQIQRLEQRVAQQDERIAQLERRLGRSSRNSSQPPSADPPSAPPRRGKDSSGRKPGGQPGHEGKGRPLLPAWAVDEVVDHWPSACGCGHVFCEAELVADGEPARHQVEELPPITVTVTEHRCQRVRCPDCGAAPRGGLPAGVAASAFGPRYHAAIAVLSIRNRISRRDVVELCEQLFGSRISTGTVDAILARVGDALDEPYEDLLEQIRQQQAPQHGRDRLADRRRPTRAVGRLHRPARRAADRRRSRRRPRQDAAGRHHRDRDLRSLVGLHPPAAAPPPDLLGASATRLHRPRRGPGRREGVRRARAADLRRAVLGLGDLPAHRRPPRPAAPDPGAAPRAQADPAPLRRQGAKRYKYTPRPGPQPAEGLARALDVRRPPGRRSRPTTTPNARCAAPSSTASCRSAASPSAASGASNGSYRPTPPAACSAAASTPTSSTRSPPTPAATPHRCSPDPPRPALRD